MATTNDDKRLQFDTWIHGKDDATLYDAFRAGYFAGYHQGKKVADVISSETALERIRAIADAAIRARNTQTPAHDDRT